MKKKRYSRTRTTRKANSAGETGKSSTGDDNECDGRVKTGQNASNFIITNKLLKNVVDMGTSSQLKSTQFNLTNAPSSANVQKDSGISSCSSSQELTSDLMSVKSFASASSQETFCSEYEDLVGSKDRVNTIQESKSFESTVSSTITSTSSNLSEASTGSSSAIFSLSSCSGQNFGLDAYGPCMICLSHPKDGVFVHSRFLHLCCCYRCAVKIWNKRKRCPICNCKVNNVQKIFVH